MAKRKPPTFSRVFLRNHFRTGIRAIDRAIEAAGFPFSPYREFTLDETRTILRALFLDFGLWERRRLDRALHGATLGQAVETATADDSATKF